MTRPISDNPPPAPEYELDDTKIKQDTADDGHVVDVSEAINEGIEIEVNEADNRRVLRKIDWHLMPVSPLNTCPQALKILIIHSDYVSCLRA